MSSFFKASCFIFWLTWNLVLVTLQLFCFSLLLGTRRFIANHVAIDERIISPLNLMNIVCATSIVFAFVGCIFLKCDIHHVCCAGLYMICIALINPGLSIYGAFVTSKNAPHPLNAPTAANVKAMVQKNLKTLGKVPRWLEESQHELKCCGINGPQDYREIYRSFPNNKCQEKIYDVPESCCVPRTIVKDNHVILMTGIHRCKINGSEDWRKQIVYSEQNKDPAAFTIQQKCDKNSMEPFKINKTEFENIIYSVGCYGHLKNNYQAMVLFLNVIFIILTLCSVLMLLAYGRNFCKSSYITGEKSDYSLDVERVSLLDLPGLNAQHA